MLFTVALVFGVLFNIRFTLRRVQGDNGGDIKIVVLGLDGKGYL